MKSYLLLSIVAILFFLSCKSDDEPNTPEIQGYDLLNKLSGHWVGSNETAFGTFDWFAFDFRPISASHVHSIFEGRTNENIITSVFVADYEGELKIMARNGGWLGEQYRATYYVLDSTEVRIQPNYFRLVDAVGGVDRSYIEFRFENDNMYFDAYKDNSGNLDKPILHMEFKGANYNPSYSESATNLFNFPQPVSEVDLNGKFVGLIDPDSALFLEEDQDPFPRSAHEHLSELTVNIVKDDVISNAPLLLYFSTEPLIDEAGNVDFDNLDRKVARTIGVRANEASFTSTYLHPDTYYITAFSDMDNNFIPSTGDLFNVSKEIIVEPESAPSMQIIVDKVMP